MREVGSACQRLNVTGQYAKDPVPRMGRVGGVHAVDASFRGGSGWLLVSATADDWWVTVSVD
jgi:hypothetical protein